MIDFNFKDTRFSLNEFEITLRNSKKPVLYWIGAGASRWAGLLGWEDLAKVMHNEFKATEVEYPAASANLAINLADYPKLFSICKTINKQKYFRILSRELNSVDESETYKRLIDAISSNEPIFIVTTNVDRCLEQRLHKSLLIQKDQIEIVPQKIISSESFILKIHGSIDSLESLVFTSEEYDSIVKNNDFVNKIGQLFEMCTVIFLGYGLADQYIVQRIQEVNKASPFFGNGPHFAIVNKIKEGIPNSIKQIKYLNGIKNDHRSAIHVVEDANRLRFKKENRSFEFKNRNLESAHLISFFKIPGTHRTAVNLTLNDSSVIWSGDGFTDDEFILKNSTAMQDLVVGLISFDKIYMSLDSFGQFFNLVGEEIFLKLIDEEVIYFIYSLNMPVIRFQQDELVGSLTTISIKTEEGQKDQITNFIERAVKITPGREKQGEEIISKIRSATVDISTDSENYNLPSLVRRHLLRKSIRDEIGMSEGVSLDFIPKWNAYPVLRFSNLIEAGIICDRLKIASVRLEYGASKLAGPAFAALSSSDYTAENIAAYVLGGSMKEDVGRVVSENPKLIFNILKFRDSDAGIRLRKEILKELKIAEGADVTVAINGSLRSIISSRTLEDAKDAMTKLMTIKNSHAPSIWSDGSLGEKTLRSWRASSKKLLRDIVKKDNIDLRDPCPCRSGDPLGTCCLR